MKVGVAIALKRRFMKSQKSEHVELDALSSFRPSTYLRRQRRLCGDARLSGVGIARAVIPVANRKFKTIVSTDV